MSDATWKRVACGIECCLVHATTSDELEVRGRTVVREGKARHYAIEFVPIDSSPEVIARAIQRGVVAIQKGIA